MNSILKIQTGFIEKKFYYLSFIFCTPSLCIIKIVVIVACTLATRTIEISPIRTWWAEYAKKETQTRYGASATWKAGYPLDSLGN